MYLSSGLLGQDDNFDKLSALWEQLQMCTIETADPALDLMTFAGNAHYFGVIMLKSKTEEKKDGPRYTNSRSMQIVGGFFIRSSYTRLINVRSLARPRHPLRLHLRLSILLGNP